MPPNIEYAVAHELRTPYGSVNLNEADGYRFLIQHDGYKIVPAIRVVQENITQADGSVLNPRYLTGLVASVKVAYYVGDSMLASAPACGADARVMDELLTGALNSIRRLIDTNQRLIWQPTGYGDRRMLLDIQLLGWPEPEYDLNGTEASVTFAVESPFPYAVDETQTVTEIAEDATEDVLNAGNAAFSPVVKVYGPSSYFEVWNMSDLDSDGDPKKFVYNASRPDAIAVPGGGQYAEIDFFKGTIILNGDSTDLVAGVDPEVTDDWHLLPSAIIGGPNEIFVVGASCTVLSNNAWA